MTGTLDRKHAGSSIDIPRGIRVHHPPVVIVQQRFSWLSVDLVYLVTQSAILRISL
jgi:hypothetical protein